MLPNLAFGVTSILLIQLTVTLEKNNDVQFYTAYTKLHTLKLKIFFFFLKSEWTCNNYSQGAKIVGKRLFQITFFNVQIRVNHTNINRMKCDSNPMDIYTLDGLLCGHSHLHITAPPADKWLLFLTIEQEMLSIYQQSRSE